MDEVQYACHRDFLEIMCFYDESVQQKYEQDLKEYKKQKSEWKEKGSIKEDEPEKVPNPFEQEAEKWIENNPSDSLYSAIGHLDSGLHYVTLPNQISRTILQAIKDTEQRHNIKTPLGIEWITGANWYQCH